MSNSGKLAVWLFGAVGLIASGAIGFVIVAFSTAPNLTLPDSAPPQKLPAVRILELKCVGRKFTGEAINDIGRTVDARIEFGLYQEGAKVGDVRARVYQWAPGERWRFDEVSYREFDQYNVQRVICDGLEVDWELVK